MPKELKNTKNNETTDERFSSALSEVLYCTQCGEETEKFIEGYCPECYKERQSELNQFNASYDFWEKCTDDERDFYIRNAI